MKIQDIRDKGSFSFLWDKELEEELYLSESYSQYLRTQIEEFPSSGEENILFSLSHSVIICYWWILEALLWKYVYEYFKRNNDEAKIRKFCKLIDYKEKTKILPDKKNPDIWLVYCQRLIKYEKFKDSMNFNYLIKWCWDQKLFDETTLVKLDNIRKIRNGIHISAIMDAKDIFSYKDLQKIIKDVKYIFQALKKAFNQL